MDKLNCPSCGSPNLTKLNAIEYRCLNCDTLSKLSQDQTFLVLQGWPCPSCGFNNENQSAYCGNCGSKLVKYCTSCRSEVQLAINFCPKCGKNSFSPNKLASQVIMVDCGRRKIDVIKVIRQLTRLGLGEAKTLAETPNAVIMEGVNDTIAQNAKRSLESAGAIVETR